MSGSFTNTGRNTDGRSDNLDAGAAHDSGLYDPERHDNQIVAVYETDTRANAARDALIEAGVSSSAVQVVGGSAYGGATDTTDQGFWGAIKSLFVPDEETTAYGHAIDRGHAMVVVHPDSATDRSRIIQVLEGTDPIDFDAKLEEWRQAGYDYSARPGAGAAMLPVAGMAPATTFDSETGTTGTGASGTGASGAAAPQVGASAVNLATGTSDTGYRAGALPTAPDNPVHAGAPADNPDTIKLMEERLRVGKREVAAGAVRVRSYVVERPVEEQVRLREERVAIERRPVDRPAAPGDMGAFQERTIEARATAEEAVVSKTAHVVEEVGIRKDANDRTETVRDTVRRTEVDVDDTTSGTNAPRK